MYMYVDIYYEYIYISRPECVSRAEERCTPYKFSMEDVEILRRRKRDPNSCVADMKKAVFFLSAKRFFQSAKVRWVLLVGLHNT